MHSDPIFVANDAGDIAILNIAFNGRGKKQVREKDSLIASAVTERLNLPLVKTGLGGNCHAHCQTSHQIHYDWDYNLLCSDIS